MSTWIQWAGGENPVPGKMVDFYYADGNIAKHVSSDEISWRHNHGMGNIVKYRVVGEESSSGKKDTNPKDAVGCKKVSFSTVPSTVIAEIAVGMTEGARKYGRHNYRAIGVRASIYYDATMRHLLKYWEGEDLDPDSGLSHITKAITSLVVMRDAMINNKFTDDRPPKIPVDFWKEIQEKVDEVFEKYPESLDAYLEGDQNV